MKHETITPKIIELAKKIAELWRMEIRRGVWIIDDDGKEALITRIYNDGKVMADYGDYTRYFTKDNPKIFPIPDIGDCLGRLEEHSISARRRTLIPYFNSYAFGEIKTIEFHESLLSALLAVLKEGK